MKKLVFNIFKARIIMMIWKN